MSLGKKLKKFCQSTFRFGLFSAFFGVVAVLVAWLYIKHVVQGRVVIVPELLGTTLSEAQKQIEAQDLIFRIDQGKVFSNVIKKDHVYLQVPRPGRKIKTGREVVVTISAGPEEKRIPGLQGETLNFSRTLLKEIGKKPDILARMPSQTYPAGRVISQNLREGADPGLNIPMALLVSDGKPEAWYVTPDFIGRDYASVKAFLDRHEFRMITKYLEEDEGLGPVVIRQIPEPGFPINRSQTLTLMVNKDF